MEIMNKMNHEDKRKKACKEKQDEGYRSTKKQKNDGYGSSHMDKEMKIDQYIGLGKEGG